MEDTIIERRGDTWIQIRGDDERFDVPFWQAQGPEAIFRASWELVVTAHEIKGLPKGGLIFDRSAFYVGAIE